MKLSSEQKNRRRVIFVLAVSPRTGTNYLKDLLLLHPRVAKSGMRGEDYLLFHMTTLEQYVQQVELQWKPRWKNSSEALRQSLGEGIARALDSRDMDETTHVVCKTPFMEGAEFFEDYFPGHRLLILYRQGQNTALSIQRMTGQSFSSAVREWRGGARKLLSMLDSRKGTFLPVSYESLSESDSALKEILEYCELATEDYDFRQAGELPVKGSSFHKQGSAVSWDRSLPRTETFSPNQNYQLMTRWQNYRFNWLAGAENQALGYENYHTRRSPGYFLSNLCTDSLELMKQLIRRIFT